MKMVKSIFGPITGIILGFIAWHFSGNIKIGSMVGITVWMAAWWITEAVPLAVTSMIPVFAFPLTGLMSTNEVASVYMNDVLFLFIGGFILSFAMERWDLHKRIALNIILKIGSDGGKILMGLMLCSYALSMWISNTATTMMLIPTTLAIIDKINNMKFSNSENITKALLIGIAYASSIGGVATIVGTPTNMIFMSYYGIAYPAEEPINFFKWFVFAMPVSFIMLGITFWVLKMIYMRTSNFSDVKVSTSIFSDELKAMGKTTFEEKTVGTLFIILVLLWFTRADLVLGSFTIKGWSNFFPYPNYIQDGAVAVFIASFLFIIPSKKKNDMLITWEQVKKLPYSVILLFGGGFALAKGFSDSGLTGWLAENLFFLKDYSPFVIVLFICLFITFISEIASNMATIQLSLPVLAAIAISTNIHPLIVMIPGTIAASYAFMMPVGTAPNTIVFGSEKLKTMDMVRPGLILNFAGILLITLAMFSLGKFVFGL
jgi:sodium-dependent dicarboxylate transporter 2/3/5